MKTEYHWTEHDVPGPLELPDVPLPEGKGVYEDWEPSEMTTRAGTFGRHYLVVLWVRVICDEAWVS